MVAVIGDGALTGGMAWEALNNIAVARDSRLVIVVNDNGRSYQPTIGGLAHHLATVRINQRYEQRAGLHQDHADPHPGGRAAAVRHPARHEEGPEGRPAAAGPVRGPRPEALGPHRRPRRAGHGDGAAPGP